MPDSISRVASNGRRGRRFARLALTLLPLLAVAAHAAAQPVQKQLLVLQSFDRGNLVVDNFTENFRVELDQRSEQPVNVVQVVVTPPGAVGARDQGVIDFIGSTFAGRRKPDLVMTIAGPASVFARKYRTQLFPDTPMLFAAVDQRYLGEAPLAENEAAVAVVNDYPRDVDVLLHVLPETRQIFMVMGSGQHGSFWRRQLEEEFTRFRDRVTFVWWDDLSLQELLRRSASLPDHSAIYYVVFDTDTAGATFADERVLAELHARSNAPLFGPHAVYLGAGIVGGSLMSTDELSRRAADAVVRLLNGAAPGSVSVTPLLAGAPTYDWRELARWRIPESRLPPGSVVHFRAPNLWSEYRGTIVAALAALVVQSLLIVGLLYQRRARRRAEIESRRNLALATDASRRETMAALTSSIGHELSQPLGSMMLNARALQTMVTTNRATSDTIDEILADIQSQGVRATQIIDRQRTMLKSRQLERKPIDLHAVIDEALALVAHDMIARQVSAAVNHSSTQCVVSGDHVLLQQVLVNLIVNAMDAMAGTEPGRRHLTISSKVSGTDVEVSVRDAGPGLPADILDRLFTPFITTKAFGLGIGLTIARSIVDAHRGTIAARNNPDGGATFTVTLRRSEARTAGDPLP